MITATLEKRIKSLEEEVKILKQEVKKGVFVAPVVKSAIKAKKLPKWLQASLKDVEEGRVSGPFSTVEVLMRHLEK